MANWKEYELKELIESINTGLDAIKRAPIVGYQTEIRCLRIQDISQSKPFKEWGFTETKFSDYEKYKLKKGDIFIARTGNSIGVNKYIEKDFNAVFNNGLARIRVNNNLALPKYIYYVIQSSSFKNHIISISGGTATQPNMKVGDLTQYKLVLPTLEKQQKISDILSKFDEKIQLNTQTNQTLESIAQAIFKSWFIDFDPVRAKARALADGKTAHQANLAAMAAISGKVVETLNETEYQQLWQIAEAFPSELGENGLPAGWKYRNADDLFEIGIGKTPPRKETEWFSDNPDDMEWISIKDMGNQGNFITESSEYLKFEAVEKFNIKKIPENTVILSFKLTVGRVAITTKETTTNEEIAHFKTSYKSNLSTEFLFCYLKSYDFEHLGSTSSIATAVNSKMIKDMKILEPNKLIVREFDNYIDIIFRKIKENLIQNKNLMRIRDELLPRLLSGEIAFV